MTQQGPVDFDAWLEDARRALSPGDADQARVMTALEKQLQLPPTPERSSDLSSDAVPHPHTYPGLGLSSARGPLRWAVRALVPVASVAVIAVIGTQLRTHPAAPSGRPAAAVVNAAASDVSPEPAADELAAPSDTQSPAQVESKDDKSAPTKKKPQRKKCRTASGLERPCPQSSSETALAVAEPERPPAAASLRQELEVLRQAQAALRNGQAAQALAVLEAFEREAALPNGTGAMQEERAAAATMARCELARSDASTMSTRRSDLYGEFVQRYPKSAYAARLWRSCLQQH